VQHLHAGEDHSGTAADVRLEARREVLATRVSRLRYAAALVALAATWLAMLLLGGGGSVDQAIYRALYAGGRPGLLAVARIFTALGEPVVLIAAGVLVLLWLWRIGRGRLGLALFAVAMLGRGLSELQKYWIAHPRPALEPHLVLVKTSSFPSGHAASSMIFYTTMALALTTGTRLHRAAVAGAILLSLLVGTSRVMLGVHWPSDVIGGWSFGLLWVLMSLPIAERLFRADSVTPAKRL
jgi:undecaprenyl-diphosphatase